jgi:inner membrane protein
MDNLTHSLVGLALGHAGLKRHSGLAMPALIIGANLPDVDATCVLLGTQSLAMRRGITHGPIALVLLPALLTLALVAFDRWQRRRGTRPAARPPVRAGALFALALVACLTHPALDWLNSYGIRLLEPFSSRWFYGDALFIIDWVLWLVLGLSAWLSLRHERRGHGSHRTARVALAGSLAYILANIGISASAASAIRGGENEPPVVVANPVPLAFWERDLLYGRANAWRSRRWSLFEGMGAPASIGAATPCALPARVAGDADANAFLFWSRLPFAQAGSDGRLILRDARFASSAFARDQFNVATPLRCAAASPMR